MASSLLNLVDILAGGIHKTKCKYKHNKKNLKNGELNTEIVSAILNTKTLKMIIDIQVFFCFCCFFLFFFSIWLFFRKHSWCTGQQGKGEGIYLTPLYHFHPLHRHLDTSWVITAENSPLHIASSRTRTGNLWLPNSSC